MPNYEKSNFLLQSRSKWPHSALTTHLPANQVNNVETTNEQHYYTEELSIINELILLDDLSANPEIIFFDLLQTPQFMGNQQQTTTLGGITACQAEALSATRVTETFSDIGEQLNTPIIGK